MSAPILKVHHVSKQYRLGQIGGTTLREELQRLQAKIFKQDDPTLRIGEVKRSMNEVFMALDDVSLEVAPGERLGIIGRNGAGKSTLLKLISRITAPTSGWIGLNGRIASMLEVGTGFHPELTGRENIYLNGAILGMKKNEIDAKIDSIIDFSECAQFIDTPVKRYSSGMYVKLAFSVASHLTSEILIMDEVLAVGDVAFQKKCLDKMNDVSNEEGRTILYVSHNMDTIRNLCEKCALLEHGKLVFLGGVEEAIKKYLNHETFPFSKVVDFTSARRLLYGTNKVRFVKALLGKDDNFYSANDSMEITFTLDAAENLNNIRLVAVFFSSEGSHIGKSESNNFSLRKGLNDVPVKIPLEGLANDSYYFEISLFERLSDGFLERCDGIQGVFPFKIDNPSIFGRSIYEWRTDLFGHVMFKPIQIQ